MGYQHGSNERDKKSKWHGFANETGDTDSIQGHRHDRTHEADGKGSNLPYGEIAA